MKKTVLIISTILCVINVHGQIDKGFWKNDTFNIAKGSTTIIAKNVKFLDLLNTFIDAGYKISKKDMDLQTATTETGPHYSDCYEIRVKDNTATIKPKMFVSGYNTLIDMSYETNRKGEGRRNLYTYAFVMASMIVHKLTQDVSYLKE